MSTNFQQSPYLRNQRKFPFDDLRSLSNEVDKTYIDIANKVNSRTIGIFSVLDPIITGEQWYLEGESKKQQTLRQVYEFTATGTISHGINPNSISMFTKPSGSFTDGTNYYGAIYASDVPIAGQVSFYVDNININIISGAFAPGISSGIIILEWLSVF